MSSSLVIQASICCRRERKGGGGHLQVRFAGLCLFHTVRGPAVFKYTRSAPRSRRSTAERCKYDDKRWIAQLPSQIGLASNYATALKCRSAVVVTTMWDFPGPPRHRSIGLSPGGTAAASQKTRLQSRRVAAAARPSHSQTLSVIGDYQEL